MFPRILGLLSLLFLTNCQHQKTVLLSSVNDIFDVNSGSKTAPDKSIDPRLANYIPMFLADAKLRGITITPESQDMLRIVRYVDQFTAPPEPGVIAVCTRNYAFDNEATKIKKIKWTTIEVKYADAQNYSDGKEIRIREVIYHELFHCFMNKGHLPKGVPGIMAPVLNKDNPAPLVNWTGLVDEMFSSEYVSMIPNA